MSEYDNDYRFDWDRQTRTGLPEVVLAEHKSDTQLLEITAAAIEKKQALFFTRVSCAQARSLLAAFSDGVFYHDESSTLYVGTAPLQAKSEAESERGMYHSPIAIVAAGTSDIPVVAEIEQTLLYLKLQSTRYVDVGVAGLWRLLELKETINQHSVVIGVAGMEGALFSVLSGLVSAPVIAVPTSVGYGVGKGGHVALNAALCGCSPGLAVVNIDNGFGAAALAAKMFSLSQCVPGQVSDQSLDQ